MNLNNLLTNIDFITYCMSKEDIYKNVDKSFNEEFYDVIKQSNLKLIRTYYNNDFYIYKLISDYQKRPHYVWIEKYIKIHYSQYRLEKIKRILND